MYNNVKWQGMTLEEWRDKVFHGMFTLGELYRMVQDGIDLSKLASSSSLSANV